MKMTTYFGILALGILLATLAHADQPGQFPQQQPQYYPQQPQQQPQYYPPQVGQFEEPPPLQQDPCCCARPACGGQASSASICAVVPFGPLWVVVSSVYGQLSRPLPYNIAQAHLYNHYARLRDGVTNRLVCEAVRR